MTMRRMLRHLQPVLALSSFLMISGSVRAWSPTQSGLLLVAVKGDQSLGIVNPASDQKLGSVPEGGITGHEVTASPDGKKISTSSTSALLINSRLERASAALCRILRSWACSRRLHLNL